jgi:uncharacterized protein (TIGR00251 family)
VIQLETHPEGIILPVRAAPGARRDEIRGEQDGELKVAVTQAPEKGKANKALREFLAKKLQLRKSQIELVSGETATHKRFVIRGLTLEELRERLEKVIS